MDPNFNPPDPNLSPPYLVHLAYLACGVLIIFYAWDRFSTPASNRSSTRQALYRGAVRGISLARWGYLQSCRSYCKSALRGPCCWVQSTNYRYLHHSLRPSR